MQQGASLKPIRIALLLAGLIAALVLPWALSGCDNAEPVIVGTPTPEPTATPEPEPFTYSATGEPLPTDMMGAEIGDENHYFRYLSFGDVIVSEYETGTFLDGVVVNAYPQPLDGEIEIAYYNSDGKLVGRGTLHNAEGTTVIPTGSSRIYAEIATDIDVRKMDFVFELKRPLEPVAEQE